LFKVITSLNLTIAVLSKTTFGSIFVSIGWRLVRPKIPLALDAMDLKIYTLAKKTVTVSKADKIISVTSISVSLSKDY
jgi:hypothetical protein